MYTIRLAIKKILRQTTNKEIEDSIIKKNTSTLLTFLSNLCMDQAIEDNLVLANSSNTNKVDRCKQADFLAFFLFSLLFF